MPMRPHKRGALRPVLFMIHCGRCGNDDAFETTTKAKAIAMARERGWANTFNDGWCDDDCLDSKERGHQK